MRTLRSVLRCSAWLVLLLGMATACATRAEVQAIVAESNASVVEAALFESAGDPLGVASGDRASTTDWESVAARIDQFVAEHPDRPDTTAPLLLRSALLAAVHRQEHRATATFERVAGEHLHTERDRALHAVRAYLPWWYRWGPEAAMSRESKAIARRALTDVGRVCDGLDAASDIRGFLEELRAWIALKLANDTADVAERNDLATAALARWAEANALDRGWLQSGAVLSEIGDGVPPAVVRRRLRAHTVLHAFARWSRGLGGAAPQWTPDWLRTAVSGLR